MTILTIFYVYYNRSFPQNLNHWLLEKSEMINLQMLIKKKYIQSFKFMLSKNMLQLSNIMSASVSLRAPFWHMRKPGI